MPMSDAQAGVLGESLFAAYCLQTTGGELEVYRPVSDDDHRDFEVNRRAGFGAAWVQVKTAVHENRGRVLAHTSFRSGTPLVDARFVYAILYVPALAIETAWLVPSADFSRCAYSEPDGSGGVRLTLEAHLAEDDAWSPFRVPPLELGPRLLAMLPAGLRRLALL